MLLGKHTIANLVDCNLTDMDNIEYVGKLLIESAKEANLHVVDSVFHKFEPIGMSGVVVLSESHIAIHTWPEYNFVAIDAFTCGEKMNPEEVCKIIAKKMNSTIYSIQTINRGFKEEEA